MFKRTITPTRTLDRLSYLWLAIAAVLYLFIGGQWVIPLAVWLAPLFLLRFVRTQHPLSGPVVDQTALHGVLIKIRDLGLPLLSLVRIEPERESESNLLLHTEAEGCEG